LLRNTLVPLFNIPLWWLLGTRYPQLFDAEGAMRDSGLLYS
jgi:hypothetical protein